MNRSEAKQVQRSAKAQLSPRPNRRLEELCNTAIRVSDVAIMLRQMKELEQKRKDDERSEKALLEGLVGHLGYRKAAEKLDWSAGKLQHRLRSLRERHI